MHVIIHFKCLPQICTKMNGFKFDFSKICWGGDHRAPSPDPSLCFFLGLRPRFGLRPQLSGASRLRLWLRPRFSGASRPRFGLRPQLSIGELGLLTPNKFLDPGSEENAINRCKTRSSVQLNSVESDIVFDVSKQSMAMVGRGTTECLSNYDDDVDGK